jgi:hypothetical protein
MSGLFRHETILALECNLSLAIKGKGSWLTTIDTLLISSKTALLWHPIPTKPVLEGLGFNGFFNAK